MPVASNWYSALPPDAPISQGDIVLDCPVASWAAAPVEVAEEGGLDEQLLAQVEVRSTDLIVMTQACDLEQFHVKTVILCPHHSLDDYKSLWEATMRSKDQNPTKKAWRSHCDDIRDGFVWNRVMLNSGQVGSTDIQHRVVDFHYIYSIPRSFLGSLLVDRNRQRLRLNSPYLESVSQSFARYFMRVGLPTPVTRVWA